MRLFKRLLPLILIVLLIVSLLLIKYFNGDNTGESKEINSVDDLAFCKVGVITGTNFEDEFKEICPDAEIYYFNDVSGIVSACQSGKIDAYLEFKFQYELEKQTYLSLSMLDTPVYCEEWSIGIGNKEGKEDILYEINSFLADIKADGTYDEMADYWFTNYNSSCKVDKTHITGENGVLVCAVEPSLEGFSYSVDGELQGYDIDIIYRFCRAYGYEPQIKEIDSDALVNVLISGNCDIGMNLIPDAEKAESVLFSDTYTSDDIVVVYNMAQEGDSLNLISDTYDSFNKTFIKDNRWRLLLTGIGTTLIITLCSLLIGGILGIMLYLWVAHGGKTERIITNVISWIMNNTPTVIFLMILYYVIFDGVNLSNVFVAVIGFSVLFSFTVYGLIEHALDIVGEQQLETALAQGFTGQQAFFKIMFPQALKYIASAFKDASVALLLETSVVGYIAVMDLTKMSDMIRGRTFEAFFPLIATACLYFLLIWLLTTVITKIEKYVLGYYHNHPRKKRLLKDLNLRN